MGVFRAAWVMFLATRLLKAVPRDEAGKRLGLAVSDYLVVALRRVDTPKATAAAHDFAKLSVAARLKRDRIHG